MKPEPGDLVGCVNCQSDFNLKPPATDSFYVPRCPTCGTVVDGYDDMADMRRSASEAKAVCDTIEDELLVIREGIQEMRREGIHESTPLSVLERATERISKLEQSVSDAADDLLTEE